MSFESFLGFFFFLRIDLIEGKVVAKQTVNPGDIGSNGTVSGATGGRRAAFLVLFHLIVLLHNKPILA